MVTVLVLWSCVVSVLVLADAWSQCCVVRCRCCCGRVVLEAGLVL